MTPEEIREIEEGLRWEAERKRRMNYKRKAAFKNALRKSRIELAIMVALVLGYFAFMIWWNCRQPLMERAAYNEGYYGVDHATAVAMAHEGFGKTAEEILKEVR